MAAAAVAGERLDAAVGHHRRGGVSVVLPRPVARTARVSWSTVAHTDQREEAVPGGSDGGGHRGAVADVASGHGWGRPSPEATGGAVPQAGSAVAP